MTRRVRRSGGGPQEGTAATRDHFIPTSRGGSRTVENRVWSCSRCNNFKGNMLPEEWGRG